MAGEKETVAMISIHACVQWDIRSHVRRDVYHLREGKWSINRHERHTVGVLIVRINIKARTRMLELVLKDGLVVSACATSTSTSTLHTHLLCLTTTTVLTALGVLGKLIGGFAATRVSGLVIDCRAFRTLLPPPGCIFSNGICILGTCKSIFLYLLFLLRRAGAYRGTRGCFVKIGGITPTMRTRFAATVTLPIILLVLCTPKFAISGPAARIRRVRRQ